MSDMDGKERNRLWWLVLTIVLVVGLMALFAALASPWGTGYGMMGWGWGVLMMVVPLVFLLLILLIAVGSFASRTAPAYVPPVSPPSSATEILDARYAGGEILREEYLRARADLEGRVR